VCGVRERERERVTHIYAYINAYICGYTRICK